MPPTKLSQLKAAMAAGDWRKAMSIASKFPQLGAAACAVKRAQDAYTNPRFARALGRDPAELIEAGKRALVERYGQP